MKTGEGAGIDEQGIVLLRNVGTGCEQVVRKTQ